MNKKILVINGHPDKESYCTALAEQYKLGADFSGGDCKLINLSDLDFSPILKHGYRKRTDLEPDLSNAQELIFEADHLVFVYPNWWGTYPALLKGFIDRVFLPGFFFDYQDNSPFPKKLLKGKSARLIVTMDTPSWYYSLIYGKPGHRSMKKSVLQFCGVGTVKSSTFGPIRNSKDEKRQHWLDKVERLGKAMR